MRAVGMYPVHLVPGLHRGIKENIYIVGNAGNEGKKWPGWGVLAERSSSAPQNLDVKNYTGIAQSTHYGSSKFQKAEIRRCS